MDTNELPLELTKALNKAEKNNRRAIRNGGYGASDVGMKLTTDNLWSLADYIAEQRKAPRSNNQIADQFLCLVEPLSDELLALLGLQTCFHSIAMGRTRAELLIALGQNAAAECWAAGLTQDMPKLAARASKAARVRYGGVNQRRKAVQAAAARAGFQRKDWSDDLLVHAGAWLIDCVATALPHLFAWSEVTDERGRVVDHSLTLQPDALAAAEEAVAEGILRRPVHLPRLAPPQPWAGWYMRNDDPRVAFRTTFLRTQHKDVAAAAKAAIKDGTLRPALDAVNALQAVSWTINRRMLGIIKACVKAKVEVDSLPSHIDVPAPILSKPWEELQDDERSLFMLESREADLQNQALRGERMMVIEDVATADWLATADRFYTPMNCDWRGRVYALCHFNFMRDDRVRSLFQFTDGMPIGEEGLRWLKIHVANCGAFDKIDKQPMDARVSWADANMEKITQCAEDPFCASALSFWTTADSPFLFLASCGELVAACTSPTPKDFITHLPVSFDGSCSGLQHLSAMTRDEHTAAMVNLLPLERPADVYSTVAERVKERVSADTAEPELSALFMAHGIDRKTAKRNVMTYSYSSKKFGMAGQQQVDMMDDLQRKVLQRKLPTHPFAPHHKGSQERPGKAARYIAGHVYEAIEENIHRPALAMKFLQGLAKTLAHECKPLRWTTPVGIPWVNRYHAPVLTRIELWMHDKGVRSRTTVKVAIGDEKEIDKDRAANGVAPNFVHALDASHLLLTVNASVADGIENIATVHDSFGCLAPQAARFNQIIRAEMVRMYETHDVLAEIYQQAQCDISQHNCDRLPPVPEYGTLNLKEIQDAPYAFA